MEIWSEEKIGRVGRREKEKVRGVRWGFSEVIWNKRWDGDEVVGMGRRIGCCVRGNRVKGIEEKGVRMEGRE